MLRPPEDGETELRPEDQVEFLRGLIGG